MFSLERQIAKLTAFNPRAEIHGEERKPAADLKIEIKVSNDVLSEFDPALKSSFYRKPDASDSQSEIPIDDPGYLPKLKFPLLGVLKYDKEFVGYEAVVHYGATEKDNVVLSDCQVDGFRFDCQDGGTVVVGFRVIAHPDESDMGRLCSMIQQDIELSLVPPEAE